jgi:hypothetical protein
MRVYVDQSTIDGPAGFWAYGPADLVTTGAGDRLLLVDQPELEDYGRWAVALGSAALRGATIQKGQTS